MTSTTEEDLLAVSVSGQRTVPFQYPIPNYATVPESITDIRSFAIELTLENTSDQDYDVVKDPSGPLFDGLPINAWTWERQSDNDLLMSVTKRPDFIGASVNWDLDSYLQETLNDNPLDYRSPHATTIPLKKGERKTVIFNGMNLPPAPLSLMS